MDMEWGSLARFVIGGLIGTFCFLFGFLFAQMYMGVGRCPDCYCPEAVCPKCPEPRCDAPIVYTSCPECQCGYNNFEVVWRDMVKEHTYSDEYNCVRYSEELARRYNDLGYNAFIKTVRVDCSSGVLEEESCKKSDGWHQIVEVTHLYLDPQSGIIEPKDYGKYGIR
jgi:hypothetical protein